MIIELHDHLKSPQRLKASRVVAYHEDGTPIGLIMLVGSGYRLVSAGEPGFDNALKIMGVDRTVVVTPLEHAGSARSTK